MFAGLPMYERPQTRAAHDEFWALVRDALRAEGLPAPEALDRSVDHMEGWGRPDLVLGQICNLPYRARFHDRVTRIAAADHGLEGCAPGYYRSLLVLRADLPDMPLDQALTRPFAYGEALSQSGWGAPWALAQARGVRLNPVLRTGGHARSLAALGQGKADLAAIDAQTFRLLSRHEPALTAAVRVIGATEASPGMTFITRAGEDPAPYARALAAAIAALPSSTAAQLDLHGIVPLPDSAYDLPLPPIPQAHAA